LLKKGVFVELHCFGNQDITNEYEKNIKYIEQLKSENKQGSEIEL